MAAIDGLERVTERINELQRNWGKPVEPVVVGYAAQYGVFVHENLEAKHTVGQAKFLEQPARENQTEIAEAIATMAAKHKDLQKAVFAGGLLLQRKSQPLVPVDTGNLRAGAFTALESEVEQAAGKAAEAGAAKRAKTEAKRNKKKQKGDESLDG